MQLCKVQTETGEVRVAMIEADRVRLLDVATLSEILHADKPASVARAAIDDRRLESEGCRRR